MRESQVPLLLGIIVYFISSLGGVAIVKFLNYRYCFTSWWIFALLSRSTWVLSAILHWILQHREGVSLSASKKQLGLYFVIAVGLSLVEVVNSYSMSVLPGSLYMLLKGSDVGWSMTLSYLMLGKTYTYSKIGAASLIMMGIGTVFAWDIVLGNSPSQIDDSSKSTADGVAAAAVLCLGGAFLNSLCSVGTEAILKQTLRDEQDRLFRQSQQSTPPSKLLLSNAYAMWTSFFSFGLLVLPVFVLAEQSRYDREENTFAIHNANATEICSIHHSPMNIANWNDADSSKIVFLVIGLSLALLGVSRFLERLCKHFICVFDSAVTFSMVQAARRWLGIYVVGLLFREGFAIGMIVGSLISGVGFVLHGRGSYGSGNQAASQKQASERDGTEEGIELSSEHVPLVAENEPTLRRND